jgi:xanthine dehydrogenase YagS FAD-binding subunit
MTPFIFTKPNTIAEALVKKNNEAQFIAGGTNLLDLMKKHIAQPEQLIDITGINANNIVLNSSGISIGTLVKNSTITTHKNILEKFPLLAKAILAGASPQIRNMATTGGNMLQRTRCPYFYDTTYACNKRLPNSGCSAVNGNNKMHAIIGYSNSCVAVHPSDMCVALAALNASVTITNLTKKTSTIPFKNFHRLPENQPEIDTNLPANHFIQSIEIPFNNFYKHCAYVKLRDRDSYAFALVSVAAALQLNGNTIEAATLASGGVAHKPWRWFEAEQFLKGKKATTDNFSAAAAIIAKQVKPLAGNAFKVTLLQGAVEIALQQSITA